MDKDTSYIAFILDMSMSMNAVREATISGFNHFLAEQQTDPQSCIFKLIMFDHLYEVRADWQDIHGIEPLSLTTYVPRRDTALLDAMGKTIIETGEKLAAMPEGERPGHVIIAILTDGMENASREFGEAQVVAMMEHQKEVYNWQFLFLASDIRTQSSPVAMAAGPQNNLAFAATRVGTQEAFTTTSSNVTRLRNS